MNDYFTDRLKELRSLYNNTGKVEWKHRYQELKQAQEHWMVEQIRSEQNSGQVKGRRYDPFSPYS